MAKKNKGHDNLIPQSHKLTVGEQSAGGKASGEARRKKKTMRELAQMLNNLPVSEAVETKLLAQGIDEENATNQMAFLFTLFNKAMGNAGKNKEPDIHAMRLWIELTDETITSKKEKEIQKMGEEIGLLKQQQAKIKAELNGEGNDIEDLTPLAELLTADKGEYEE